jgi:peptide deformylase
MALRNIRTNKDEILRKRCRNIDEVTDRIKILAEDMKETMYNSKGVGLAGPQVGILRRIVVIDVGEGPYVLINPEILEISGSQIANEGCLSLPGIRGEVDRPDYVKVRALNENGEKIEIEAKGLFARAMMHEIDHLDGILFIDKIIREGEK